MAMEEEEEGEPEATSLGAEDIHDTAEQGVLLYYKFVQIPEPEKIKSWIFQLSSSLRLLGRIRVAPDGINVTVGGKMTALRDHMKTVSANPLFVGIDFKLAASSNPVDHNAAAECGFTSLSARLVKELVTLGLHPSVEPPSVSKAGKHVTAQEFHDILQEAVRVSEAESRRKSAIGAGAGNSPGGRGTVNPNSLVSFGNDKALSRVVTPTTQQFPKKIVVLDARNLYETRIGKFCLPEGVQVMDPRVRQYSDLPGWIDEHEDSFRNNQVLMYCTGGVRCEMASAYIRSKGREFEDVLQLSGGIQRYLEAFPDGGYFAGKNFVFDYRLAVPSTNKKVVGSCLVCHAWFDDYTDRCRCSSCRMLVLVCTGCQVAGVQESSGTSEYICELCSKETKTVKSRRQVGPLESPQLGMPLSASTHEVYRRRKLRILCLHGFRQSASSLKGRLNALKKKLRREVEFVFVDAPHEIPSVHLGASAAEEETLKAAEISENSPSQASSAGEARKVSRKFAWLIEPVATGYDEAFVGPQSRTGRTEFVTRCDDSEAQPRPAATAPFPGIVKHPIETLDYSSQRPAPSESGATTANCLQYETQCDGWSMSWEYLKTVFAERGPFDGVLGFSQGAAVAAALCTLRAEAVSFDFVILCSGFCSRAVEHQHLMSSSCSAAAIDCPSMHVFGGSPGLDRQIGVCESEKLASLFRSDNCKIVRHKSGHIVPTQPEYVQQYLEFLGQFQ